MTTIDIEVEDDDLLRLTLMAHERDITLNEMFVRVLRAMIRVEDELENVNARH